MSDHIVDANKKVDDVDEIAEKLIFELSVDFDGDTEIARAALLEYGAIVREECAKKCDGLELHYYNEYRTGASRGNPYTEGLSDGSADCAAAIRTEGQ